MPKKSKKRRAWTATEVRELKTMAKKKTAASQIARKLKRTEGATRQKAFSIGLSLDFLAPEIYQKPVFEHESAPACARRPARCRAGIC